MEWAPTVNFPRAIGLEVSTVCNLRCVMCPLTHSGGKVDRPAFPDATLIQKLLPYMRKAEVLRLFGVGEPLLSPAFWSVLKELNHGEHPKQIEVHTNGLLLNDENIIKILDSPLSLISISLDAARPETYHRLRGSSLSELLDRIKLLISERNLRKHHLHIQLNMTIMRENIEELPELLNLARELNADSIRFWELEGSGGGDLEWQTESNGWQFFYSKQLLSSFPEIRDHFVSLTKEKSKEYGIPIDDGGLKLSCNTYWTKQQHKGILSKCYFPLTWLDVLSNGMARLCCYGLRGIGNIMETSVENVWNGAMAKETRTLLSQNIMPEYCHGAGCGYVLGFNAEKFDNCAKTNSNTDAHSDNMTTSSNNLSEQVMQLPYPKISIVTPSFNQGDFIEKTITSVISQNYPNLEYIIIDGGSADQSVEIIKKYSGHLTYWCSEKDNGQSDAINKGLARATGEIFNWLCSDDYLEPGALFKLAEAYQADPHAAGWVGGCRWVDNNYNEQWVFYPHSLDFSNFARNFNGKQLSQPSCFLNARILKEISGVDLSFTYTMDFNLWLRMLQRGIFKIGQGLWSNYYFHSEAKTVKNRELSYKEASKVQRSFGLEEAAERRLTFYHAGEKDYWPFVIPEDLQREFSQIAGTINTVGRFNTEQQKILFISTNVPAPENHAADKRICQILNILLANNFDIHFAYLTDNIKDRQFALAFGDRINFYHITNHNDFQNPDIFVQLVRELDPATVFITNCWWLQYCLLMTHVLIQAEQNNLKARFVVDTMDFHYKHYMRKYNVSNEQQDLQEAENFLIVENEFYSRAGCVVVVTEEEKNDVLKALKKPIKEIKSIPTIHEVIDQELLSLVPMESRANNICFVGNFGSQHNVEAVRFFLREVLPRIQKGFHQTGYPDPEFHIIGINLEPYRQEFASSHVKVIGFVEDLQSLLCSGNYKIMVCPLVFGSGIKGKLGDAAGVGLPFVTTSIGAEGFPVQDGVDCFIADDPAEFASKCIQLMTDNVVWHNFSIRSRIMVHNNYSLYAVSNKLKELVGGSAEMTQELEGSISRYERIMAMKEQGGQQPANPAGFLGDKPSKEQIYRLLQQIQALPSDWHKAGSLDVSVLAAFVKHAAHLPLEHSIETGSGKSTLLLSNISRHHLVFALDAGDSISCVKQSPYFNHSTVEYVEGPTQTTLPYYRFNHKLDFALIDGPHGYPFPEMEYYFIYPHLKEGAILVVDDIHIPTIFNLFKFLLDESMFEFLEIVNQTTAFFRRTSAPMFSPTGDGWWEQEYNKKNFPESMLSDELRKLLGR